MENFDKAGLSYVLKSTCLHTNMDYFIAQPEK